MLPLYPNRDRQLNDALQHSSGAKACGAAAGATLVVVGDVVLVDEVVLVVVDGSVMGGLVVVDVEAGVGTKRVVDEADGLVVDDDGASVVGGAVVLVGAAVVLVDGTVVDVVSAGGGSVGEAVVAVVGSTGAVEAAPTVERAIGTSAANTATRTR